VPEFDGVLGDELWSDRPEYRAADAVPGKGGVWHHANLLSKSAEKIAPFKLVRAVWRTQAAHSRAPDAGHQSCRDLATAPTFIVLTSSMLSGRSSLLGFAKKQYRCKSGPSGLYFSTVWGDLLLPERRIQARDVDRVQILTAPNPCLMRICEQNIDNRPGFRLSRTVDEARHVFLMASGL